MGTACAWVVYHIWGYSDPLIYYAFLCRILVLLLPLIPYFVHFPYSKVLIFFMTTAALWFNGDGHGDGVKADGDGMGRGNFCGDGVGMGLMSTTVSLMARYSLFLLKVPLNTNQLTNYRNQQLCCRCPISSTASSQRVIDKRVGSWLIMSQLQLQVLACLLPSQHVSNLVSRSCWDNDVYPAFVIAEDDTMFCFMASERRTKAYMSVTRQLKNTFSAGTRQSPPV